jgi:hypothetical protein
MEARTSLGRAGVFAAALHAERLPRPAPLPGWFHRTVPVPGRGSFDLRPRVATGASVRRALGLAETRGATLGSTIFLARPPERSPDGVELLAHETAHALERPIAPRFFLGGLLDAGEQRARTFARRARTFADDTRRGGEAEVRRRLQDAQATAGSFLRDQGVPMVNGLPDIGSIVAQGKDMARTTASNALSAVTSQGRQELTSLEQQAGAAGDDAVAQARGLADGLSSRARQEADRLTQRGSNAVGSARSMLSGVMDAVPPSAGSASRSASDLASSAFGSAIPALPKDIAGADPAAMVGRSLGSLLGSSPVDTADPSAAVSNVMRSASAMLDKAIPQGVGQQLTSMAGSGRGLVDRVTGLLDGATTSSAAGRTGFPQLPKVPSLDGLLGKDAIPSADDLLGGVLKQLPDPATSLAALRNAIPETPGTSSLPVGGLAGMAASGFDAANAFAARTKQQAGSAFDQATGAAQGFLGGAMAQGTQAAQGLAGRATSALDGIQGLGRTAEGSLHHAMDQGMSRVHGLASQAGGVADRAHQAFDRATSGLAALTGSIASAATDPHSQMGELLEVLEERLLAELERRGGRHAGVF